jgi:hypothetical protein
LQGKNVTACDAKAAADTICAKLVKMREDTEFDTFWERATTTAEELQLSDPTVPRVRRPPRRIDSGSTPSTFPSPKEYFRKIYFEFLDRFDQKSFYLYLRAEQLVLKAASTGEILDDNLRETCQHFGTDFDHSRLRNQLAVLHDLVSRVNSDRVVAIRRGGTAGPAGPVLAGPLFGRIIYS